MMKNCFIGVVEDRHDPEQMGRVRVRVFALHNEDRKNEVPINSLPWSPVVQSPMTPSVAGSVHQLKEGSWVLVMYLDENYQNSVVLGSVSTKYGERPNYEEGFSDPFGVHPRLLDETSLVAREDEYLKHPTYAEREKNRVTDVPIAKRSATPTVSGISGTSRQTWDEPDLRGGQDSKYPYNAVREFEAGHLEEYDSTPDNSRITKTHRSGTYEEITHDGSRVIKIVGDGYSVTLKDKNVLIKGDLNLSIEGNMNHYVKGNYIVEVGGDYSISVAGSKQTKVNKDNLLEVVGTESLSIGGNQFHSCQGNRTLFAGGTTNIQANTTNISSTNVDINGSAVVSISGGSVLLN
jgi:hypothetical protein